MATSVNDGRVAEPEAAGNPVPFPHEIFWNLPNTITVVRVGVVPVLLLLPWFDDRAGSQFIAWAFRSAALQWNSV